MAYLRRLSRRFPTPVGVHLTLGAACQAANELGEAAAAFGRAIQLEPTMPRRATAWGSSNSFREPGRRLGL
jgi:cytochrome c-type biogenesis protein CcmH/NrfG